VYATCLDVGVLLDILAVEAQRARLRLKWMSVTLMHRIVRFRSLVTVPVVDSDCTRLHAHASTVCMQLRTHWKRGAHHKKLR
jgi:hypothetical protein